MNLTEKLYQKRKDLIPNALGIFNPSSIQKGIGSTIIDADGNQIIDFGSGIGVNNIGHSQPNVVEAIKQQVDKFIHSSFNCSIYQEYLDLAERLVELIPIDGPSKVMLTMTGAESVENAIKIARNTTKKSAIICFDGAFHGRSYMAQTLTSNVKYKAGCAPFVPEVYRAEFPYYGPKQQKLMTNEQYDAIMIERFNKTFSNYVALDQVAAVIIELVQGEGGFTVASKGFIKYLREFCTLNNIILIFDEVQSGFGRTGSWTSYQHYGVNPDLTTIAKAMGGGMPIGAVVGKQPIMDAITPGVIGGTYLGNPVCCVAASATIDYMKKVDINQLGRKVGEKVEATMKSLQIKFPDRITDVRGIGAMLAFEFTKNGKPDTDAANQIKLACLEKGLLIITAGTYSNCIRVLSPLNIPEDLLDKGLGILSECTTEVLNQ